MKIQIYAKMELQIKVSSIFKGNLIVHRPNILFKEYRHMSIKLRS